MVAALLAAAIALQTCAKQQAAHHGARDRPIMPKSGADGGTRTRTPIGRGILSPVRLPISPRPRVGTGRAGARLGQAGS